MNQFERLVKIVPTDHIVQPDPKDTHISLYYLKTADKHGLVYSLPGIAFGTGVQNCVPPPRIEDGRVIRSDDHHRGSLALRQTEEGE